VKVLIYGEYFLPIVGGVQTALKLLAQGLAESHPNGGTTADRFDVTLVTRAGANGHDDSALPYRVVRKPGFLELVRLLRSADVIHLAGPCLLPMLVGWLLGKPIAVEHHGYHAACPNGLLFYEPTQTQCPGHFMARRYGECARCNSASTGKLGSLRLLVSSFPRRWLCQRIAGNIAISDHVATRLQLPRSRTIYYGIAVPAQQSNADAGRRSPVLEIAYVGRLVAEKGLPVLLEAAKRLHDDGVGFHLTLIGDGPERARLESLIDSFGLQSQVSLTGDLRGDELEQAVARIEAVVMPSVWEETAGLAAIEQMMRGRVVVAADIGGLAEVVGDAGLKFTPGDSKALYSCLLKLAEPGSEISRLRQRARARALEKFSLAAMVIQHGDLYRKICGRRPGDECTLESGAVRGTS
jgi:glycosyltransferase involved in cell wall biosynthesis